MTADDALPASESSEGRTPRDDGTFDSLRPDSTAGTHGEGISSKDESPEDESPDDKSPEDRSSGGEESYVAPARYSIGEVGDRLDLESHVLRYWESEFDLLDPEKDAAGRRVYGEADVRTVKRIQHLLKVEMYTIAGARQVLEREGINGRDVYRDELRTLRSFLVDIRDCLRDEPGSS